MMVANAILDLKEVYFTYIVRSSMMVGNGVASLKIHPSTLPLFTLSQAHVVPLKPRLRTFHKKNCQKNWIFNIRPASVVLGGREVVEEVE